MYSEVIKAHQRWITSALGSLLKRHFHNDIFGMLITQAGILFGTVEVDFLRRTGEK
jgi:hypothetical protein